MAIEGGGRPPGGTAEDPGPPAADPLVSVVIPTHARSDLVGRAVASALGQTLQRLEVIVVVDGADPATREALAAVRDPRLRVVEVAVSAGASRARNRGVREARASWIALLDDDDEWMPAKLEAQLALATRSSHAEPVVSCRVLLKTGTRDYVLPRRLPEGSVRVGDYLFVRRGFLHGEGFVQTSTIMAPRQLLERVPFDESLPRWQETDWLIRALALDGTGLEMAPDVLTTWNDENGRQRISGGDAWRDAFAVLQARRALLSPRAYAAALLSVVGDAASVHHDPRTFAMLWREAVTHGSPTLLDHLTYLRIWLVPRSIRRWLAAFALARASRRLSR